MSLFVLDTDTITLLQHSHPKVLQRVDAAAINTVFASAVSVQEQVQGRLAVLNAARTADQIAIASAQFTSTITFYCKLPPIPMSADAFRRFQTLVRMRLNIGGYDLRIAAIALEIGATVVTRNTRDFSRVPGLPIVDWSV